MTSDLKEEGPGGTYLASAHLHERREPRYQAKIEIEVTRIDQSGELIRERTATSNVSEWGCGFLLQLEVKTGDILLLRMISPGAGQADQAPQGMFQVVRVEREASRWAVGVWKMDSTHVWGTHLEELGKMEHSKREARKAEPESGDDLDREREK